MNKHKAFVFFTISIFFFSMLINRLLIFPTIYGENRIVINSQIDTIFMGASHAMTGINVENFPNMQNYGSKAEPLFLTYYKLKFILSKTNNIKKVVLSTFPAAFTTETKNALLSGNYSNKIVRDYFFLLDKEGKAAISSSKNYRKYIFKYYLGIIPPTKEEYKLFYMGIFNKLDFSHYPSAGGFDYRTGSSVSLENAEKVIRKHYYADENSLFGTSDFSLTYLEKIIQLCKDNGIELSVVRMPEYSPYTERIPELFVSYYDNLIDEIIEYGIAYHDLSEMELSDDYFFDSDHLNGKGSVIVSETVIELIE